MKAMTQTQLIEAILQVEESGVTKKQVKDVLDSLAYVVGEAVEGARPVKIPGVCTIKVRVKKATKARMGRNPATGEEVKIKAKPASTALTLRPTTDLKKALPSVNKARAAERRK